MGKEDISSKVNVLLEDYLSDKDLETYKIEYKKEGKDWVLRVYLDKPMNSENEYVNIEECEMVTRYLSDILDEQDIIDRSYNLEVCSPGLDRELIKDSDFIRFIGKLVDVKTYEQIDGSKNFEGILLGKTNNVISIEIDGKKVELPDNKISKINLAVVF